MRNFALLFLGVVVGWAASGVDWSREAVGEEGKLVQAQVGLAETPVDRYKALRAEIKKLDLTPKSTLSPAPETGKPHRWKTKWSNIRIF